MHRKIFQCSYCPKMVISSQLSLHIDKEHPEKSTRPMTHACYFPGCDAVFPRPCILKAHERRHTPVKRVPPIPQKCPICEATFKSLKLHMMNYHNEASIQKRRSRIHHYRKPIPCDICGKTLMGPIALRIHQRAVHQRIRHNCPYCEKTYTSLSDMRCHVRAVHEGLRWNCRYCSIEFLRGSQRNQHERQAHAEELERDKEKEKVL